MMDETIRNFPSQFGFEPKIENRKNLRPREKVVVCGMGGSHLAADILGRWKRSLPLVIHRDYGLPDVGSKVLKKSLVILSSYSGNTEEVLDAGVVAKKKGYAMAAIAVGGHLLEFAKRYEIPFVALPDTGIQPRSALGYSLRAFLALLGEKKALQETKELSRLLDPDAEEFRGRRLSEKLRGSVPIIYTSTCNTAIAYNWKIKLNETGKIPAFYNVFPELNHNEMAGFDIQASTRMLSQSFHFLFLHDSQDHPKIQKRMEILAKLFRDRQLPFDVIELGGKTVWEKVFRSLLLADWVAFYTASLYGVEAEQVPMVEEFKTLLQ